MSDNRIRRQFPLLYLALVPRTSAEKPEESDDMGTFRPACRSLDPECHDPAPASRYAL
jgi:hypothetical protein